MFVRTVFVLFLVCGIDSAKLPSPATTPTVPVKFSATSPAATVKSPAASKLKQSSKTIATASKDKIDLRYHTDGDDDPIPAVKIEDGKIITVRYDTEGRPEQQCQCVIFHKCDPSNIYYDSYHNQQVKCENDLRVCCNIPTQEDYKHSLMTTYETVTLPSPSYGRANDDYCECVPDNKCTRHDTLVTYSGRSYKTGSRSISCEPGYVCCPQAYIAKSDCNEKNVETKTTGYYSNDETTISNKDECKCIEPYRCSNNSLIEQYGGGSIGYKNQFNTCTREQVCCLLADILPEKSEKESISYPPNTESHQTSECTCVKPYLCSNKSLEQYGAGSIIYKNQFTTCSYEEVCCPSIDILQDPAHVKPDPAYPVEPYKPDSGEHIKPVYEEEKEKGKCVCVSHESCKASFHKNQFSCGADEICCPPDEITKENPIKESYPTSYPTPTPGEYHHETPKIPDSSSSECCSCVKPELCKPAVSTYGEGSILYKNQFTSCARDEICCPLGDVVKETKWVAAEYECGHRKETDSLSHRISGFEDETHTSFGEFPWMTLILNKEKPEIIACGASLITPHLVLTAAHCVKNLSKYDILVRVGEYNTLVSSDSEPAPHQDRHVSEMDIHPHFNPVTAFNDIALLVVDKPFTYAPNVAPICLPLFDSQFSPTQTEIYDFKRCVATGWGKDAYDREGKFQHVLRKIDLKIIKHDVCQSWLRKTPELKASFKLHDSFICAGGESGKDTCQGDGGGPLICPLKSNPTRYVQVGITSWGIGCGQEHPSMYSSLLHENAKWLTSEFNLYKQFETVFKFGGYTDTNTTTTAASETKKSS